MDNYKTEVRFFFFDRLNDPFAQSKIIFYLYLFLILSNIGESGVLLNYLANE